MRRPLRGFWAWAVKGIAIAYAIFHLYTAAIGLLPDQQQRAIHALFGLTLTLMVFNPGEVVEGRPRFLSGILFL